jgi:hypothetical protein
MSRLTKAIRRLFGIKRRHNRNADVGIGPLKVNDYTPNFFIVGAARCGTTSLWEYLRQHPDIYMPPVIEQKEPAFFCDLYGVEHWDFYLTLFEAGNGRKRIGEASTPYLSSPESPGQIRSVLPHAKIIITLRNPVVRAYSLYKWMHANGYEKLATFAEALEAETAWRKDNGEFKKNNGQYYYNFLYYHSGLYYPQVKRYIATFPADQIHLIIFEEFVKEPLQHVQQIFRFLDVDPSFVPRLEVNNPSAAHYPALDPALRQRLTKMYARDVAKLEKLIGRNLRALWI